MEVFEGGVDCEGFDDDEKKNYRWELLRLYSP